MGIIIRTGFNNQNWSGRCNNVNEDYRLFPCKEGKINVEYKVKNNQCIGDCWEQKICSDFTWLYTKNFGDRAKGEVFFIHYDFNDSFVLWGKSRIKKKQEKKLIINKFKPLPKEQRVNGLTYEKLDHLGVPEWRAGPFRYINDDTALKLNNLIANQKHSAKLNQVSKQQFVDPIEAFCDEEGRLVLREHIFRERSPELIRRFKEQPGNHFCSVCDFSFYDTYGNLGTDFIEAHHIIPVSSLKKEKKTYISDLVAVCSNCHRMLHRSNPPLSIEELSLIVKRNKNS